MSVNIYTDGACSGNPGIGGWGVVILKNSENPIFLNGGELETTNNRMELMATIKALAYFNHSTNISIFTDSKYVKDGIESWIIKWKKNNWKTSSKKKVKNIDLWKELDNLNEKYHIKWCWIKGHSGNILNDEVDQLAREAAM